MYIGPNPTISSRAMFSALWLRRAVRMALSPISRVKDYTNFFSIGLSSLGLFLWRPVSYFDSTIQFMTKAPPLWRRCRCCLAMPSLPWSLDLILPTVVDAARRSSNVVPSNDSMLISRMSLILGGKKWTLPRNSGSSSEEAGYSSLGILHGVVPTLTRPPPTKSNSLASGVTMFSTELAAILHPGSFLFDLFAIFFFFFWRLTLPQLSFRNSFSHSLVKSFFHESITNWSSTSFPSVPLRGTFLGPRRPIYQRQQHHVKWKLSRKKGRLRRLSFICSCSGLLLPPSCR